MLKICAQISQHMSSAAIRQNPPSQESIRTGTSKVKCATQSFSLVVKQA